MSTLEELVTVKMTRMELYQILDAAITKNDTAFSEVVAICNRNLDLSECEAILSEIDEDFEDIREQQRERNFIISQSIRNDR